MSKSIKEIAFVVSLGTLLSKFGGMTRQLVIAGAFGISAAYDAYNYACLLYTSPSPRDVEESRMPSSA